MRDTALERFKRDMENLQKAGSRITASASYDGGPEPAAVAWLLRFLSADLASQNEWQRDETFWNVIRFCFDIGQDWSTNLTKTGPLFLTFPEKAADRTNFIEQIQRDARAALVQYLTIGVGKFPKVEGEFFLIRDQPLRYSGKDIASSFYYMTAQLLSRYGHRIKQCEGCPLIMLVGRKDQRFHSPSCQILTFVRKTRAKKKAARLAKEATKKSKTRQKHKDRASRKGGTRHAKR